MTSWLVAALTVVMEQSCESLYNSSCCIFTELRAQVSHQSHHFFSARRAFVLLSPNSVTGTVLMRGISLIMFLWPVECYWRRVEAKMSTIVLNATNNCNNPRNRSQSSFVDTADPHFATFRWLLLFLSSARITRATYASVSRPLLPQMTGP